MSKNKASQEKTHSLSQCIDYYELCNRSEGKSPRTVDWYSENLRCFRTYLKTRHVPDSAQAIDTKLLREYVLHLFKRHRFDNHPSTPAKNELLSVSTIHGHVRTLRAFFSWLDREGIAQGNPAKDLKPPTLVKKVISTLSDEEIQSIIRQLAPGTYSDARNQTIFMLLIDSGIRIGELVSLKMDDMHLNEGYLKVMGKGKKERIVPIGSNAQKALQRYLFRYRPEPASPGIDTVFLSIHGSRLTENSIKLMFSKLARISGVHRLHAHLCRHTFATRFLLNGGDVFTLQQILGHSTLEMVRHYVSLASSHVAMQHQKFSPLDRLDLKKA